MLLYVLFVGRRRRPCRPGEGRDRQDDGRTSNDSKVENLQENLCAYGDSLSRTVSASTAQLLVQDQDMCGMYSFVDPEY